MIPKVIFKYSSIYDELWKKFLQIGKRKNGLNKKEILNYIKRVERLWRKYEKDVLKELSRITKLNWKSKYIYCYVVERCKPFSDPLTLQIYKPCDLFIDVLIHELIHILLSQNYKKTKKAWKYVKMKYKREAEKTRIHVVVQAIHKHIYLKFFGEERLERDIERISKFNTKIYVRAWKIISKEGYENIIKEFVRMIK